MKILPRDKSHLYYDAGIPTGRGQSGVSSVSFTSRLSTVKGLD